MNGYPRFGWVDIVRFQHHEGSDIKHIYFVAETKGYDKDSLKDYRRAESVKIECASRHFATISDSHVTYDVVKNYDELWNIITKP